MLEALVEDLLEKFVSLLHQGQEGALLHGRIFNSFFEVDLRTDQLLVVILQLVLLARRYLTAVAHTGGRTLDKLAHGRVLKQEVFPSLLSHRRALLAHELFKVGWACRRGGDLESRISVSVAALDGRLLEPVNL